MTPVAKLNCCLGTTRAIARDASMIVPRMIPAAIKRDFG
jgi:hypothetical protein